jgi:predicted amidophosphoribosyltransferase
MEDTDMLLDGFMVCEYCGEIVPYVEGTNICDKCEKELEERRMEYEFSEICDNLKW